MKKIIICFCALILATSCTREVPTKYENIYEAAKAGDAEDVILHLKKHAPIETKREGGKTALHAAAIKGDTSIVKILIQSKANIEALDDFGNKPLDYAVASKKYNIVVELINAGADTKRDGDHDLELSSIRNDDWKMLQLLIDRDPHNKDETYLNMLLDYAVLSDAGMIISMSLKGADFNKRNSVDETPLLTAAELGKDKAVSALCNIKVDVDVQDRRGFTPLHLAVINNDFFSMLDLLSSKANPNIRDKRHRMTPEEWAKDRGYNNLAEYLRDYRLKQGHYAEK